MLLCKVLGIRRTRRVHRMDVQTRFRELRRPVRPEGVQLHRRLAGSKLQPHKHSGGNVLAIRRKHRQAVLEQGDSVLPPTEGSAERDEAEGLQELR